MTFLNLPERCVGYVDEIIMPVFYNVQSGVNDILYIAIFRSGGTTYYTDRIAEMNYNLEDLAARIGAQLNPLDADI